MELIVAKSLSKIVWLTRLPVGHTHEDIDAMFARIWEYSKKFPCLCPGDYAKMVEEALKGPSYQAKVIDINVIPDYNTFLLPHIGKSTYYYCE